MLYIPVIISLASDTKFIIIIVITHNAVKNTPPKYNVIISRQSGLQVLAVLVALD